MQEMLKALLLASSIPSAIVSTLFGIFAWKYKKREERKEAEIITTKRKEEALREAKDKAMVDFMIMNIKSTNAAITVSEAIGNAVARIPDAHCNGDMHEALNYAGKVKNQMRDFMTEQGVHHIFED